MAKGFFEGILKDIMLAGAVAGLIFYAIHNRSRKDPAVK